MSIKGSTNKGLRQNKKSQEFGTLSQLENLAWPPPLAYLGHLLGVFDDRFWRTFVRFSPIFGSNTT